MTKLSLLNKDTSTVIDKIKKVIAEKKENTSLGNESSKKSEDIKFNHSYNNDLSKTGLGNTMRGTNEVINNQNKIFKENSMGKIIPIKQIILEFTADHMREHAGKYAAGTMLGLGTAAGYMANGGLDDGGNSEGFFGKMKSPIDTRSDFQKDLGNASVTKHESYHNQDKGILGNAADAVKQFTGNLRAENKFNDMAQAQEDYNKIKDSEGSLLNGGQMAGLGATALGAGIMATKLKRRKV